jgi:hypothetical protein
MKHYEAMVSFSNPATFWQRIPLRMIGLGVILLSDKPLYHACVYYGNFWNVGCWTLAERPVTTLRGAA